MKRRLIIAIVTGLIVGLVVVPLKEPLFRFVSEFYRFTIKKEQYELKENGVGDIYIGCSLVEAGEKLRQGKFRAEFLDEEVEDSLNASLIRVYRKNNWVMDLKIADSSSMISAIVAGPLCESKNGISAGMDVSEYLQVCKYESDSILYFDKRRNYNSIEYFRPFYFQTDTTAFKVVTASYWNNRIGRNYHNVAIFNTRDDFLKTSEYDKTSPVTTILIHNTDEL